MLPVKKILIIVLSAVLLLSESFYTNATSTQTWNTLFSNPEIGGLDAIAWNGGVYVAVGGKNTILTSADGMNWTSSTGQGAYYRGVAWGNKKFVIVTEDGGVLTSSDDKKWLYKKISSSGFRDITWTGKQFVAVGEKGLVVSSSDGIKWSQRKVGTSDTLQGILYNGTTFVVVKENEYDGKALFTSLDGIKWTRRPLSQRNMVSAVGWNGKRFVAVGDGGIIYISDDGSKWVQVNTPYEDNLYDIVWNGKKFCAVGTSGTILESTDGSKWTKVDSATDCDIQSIMWNGNHFVAAGGLVSDIGTIITDNPNKVAIPTDAKILINSKVITVVGYSVDGNNYFKLRDLATILLGTKKQFDVEWDSNEQRINILTNTAYSIDGELDVSTKTSKKEAKPTTANVLVDGRKVDLTVYNIGGNNYFMLRDVAKIANFGVDWDQSTSTISIDTSSTYTD